MITIYKLSRTDRTTRNGFKWGEKGWRPPPLDGAGDLCSSHWYHGYESPLIAAMQSPIHGTRGYGICFGVDCEPGDIRRHHDGMIGFRRGVVGDDVPIPSPSTEQRVRYAICFAWQVYTNPAWRLWAERWISGQDRSREAAEDAEDAAAEAWDAAVEEEDAAAEEAAAWAAWSAAAAAAAREEAEAETWAAWAAERAAWSEEARGSSCIQPQRIAEWAMTDQDIEQI